MTRGPIRREPIRRESWLRLRAGLLVLAALGFLAVMAGRWMMALFGLPLMWAALAGVVSALLAAAALSALERRAYLALAAGVTLFGAYAAYDFVRGPIDWSREAAAGLALGVALLLGAALWDFGRLLREFRAWMAARG